MQQKVNLSILVILLCIGMPASTSASTESSASSEQPAVPDLLSRLLGFPTDVDVGNENATAPDIMKGLYECWSSTGTPRSCLVEGEPLEDIDTVRSFVGTIDKSVPSDEEFALIFNTTCYVKPNETPHSAEVRIYKEALSEEEINLLESSECDLTEIQLELYAKITLTGQMSLQQIVPLTREQLTENMWVVFPNVTHAYLRWIADTKASVNNLVSLRLALGGSCASTHPAQLGFTSKLGKEPLILGFSENIEDVFAMPGALPPKQPTRSRRQLQTTNSTDYSQHSCRLYPLYITFEALGWSDYIISPEGFQANFCTGRCDTYQIVGNHNSTKHSYIQSIAYENNDGVIPPPCCAPHEVHSLPILYREGPETFVLHIWSDMLALSCGCL